MKVNHPNTRSSVAVVGAAMCKFGSYPDKNSRDLFVEAYKCLRNSISKGLDPKEIQAIYIGNFSSDQFEGQAHMAPLMVDSVGLTPRPAIRVEDACASGGVALRQGVLAILSGLFDLVMVAGVEKMTSLSNDLVTSALASASDVFYEVPSGFTFPGFYAAMSSVYMHKYSMKPEHLMHVAIKNHANGALNPKAQLSISIEDWMEKRKESFKQKGLPTPNWRNVWDFLFDDRVNPLIAWPLRLFDCSPITDGAAAVLLASEKHAHRFTDDPIYIIGSGQASDCPLHDRMELSNIPSAQIAASQAYDMAGIKADDINFAEVHDCFTYAEIVATEDLGFFKQGEGFIQAQEGVTARDGSKPINSSGGLKAKGHPVGASGVAQIVEVWEQMHSLAGPRQIAGKTDLALTHNVGGTGQTCVVHIFERR